MARPLPLSERVPVLENMGFRVVDERTFHVEPQGSAGVWFHDMLLERADGGSDRRSTRGKARCEAAFLMVMRGAAENDGYNALTLHGGLAWRDVALIRTLSRFLRQIRVPYSQDYMWATLVKHAGIAGEIVDAVPRPLRSRAPTPAADRRAEQRSRPKSRRRYRRSTASTKTASSGASSMPCSRRSAPISISSAQTASRSR